VLKLEHVWYVVGAFLVGVVVQHVRERKWRTAGFWALAAAPFFVGDLVLDAARAGVHWPAQAMGGGVIALALLALGKRPALDDDRDRAAREASAARFGNWLFAPALAIPLVLLAIFFAGKLSPGVGGAIDPAQVTLVGLAIASIVSAVAALVLTRAPPRRAVVDGRRLLDQIGWAAVLPMMLATLGTVFAKTGVGDAIAHGVDHVIPADRPYACLVVFALGMVVFTVITGNAFAAFPVITLGIGLPLLVVRHGADPAALGAIGMVTGYCGTLVTPMAANFNLVPAALLELRDDHGVIRAQWPTAAVLFVINVAVMAVAIFR